MGNRTDTDKSNTSNGLSESCSSVWRKMLTAHALLFELMERELSEAKLPPLAWYDVLWSLEQAPEQRLRLHELANVMIIQRSNLTRLIDRLEAQDLVCRRNCPSDRRGAYAAITEAGKTKRHQMWQVYSQAIDKYFAQHLGEADLATFDRVLDQVIVYARDEY